MFPTVNVPSISVSPDSTVTISLVILLIGAVYAIGQFVGSSRTRNASVIKRLDDVEQKVDDIYLYLTTGQLSPRKKKEGNLMTL